MSSYIPKRSPDAKFRTLIVLLDGTGDSVDNDVTNIVRLRDMLCDEWNENQKVLYVQGIGSKMDDSWQSWTHRMIDQAIAGSFHKFVIKPYEWLAQNYNDGDKICIFGFSRGAYTARVLAGMINGLGLLPKEKSDQGEKVYDQYDDYAQLRDKARGDPGKLARLFNVVYPLLGKAKIEPERNPEKKEQELLASLKEQWDEFKVKNECQEVFIDFLGCWDSVNSVGYGSSIKLPLTRTNDMVRTFRHAIALDEHRVKFKQTNWKGPRKEGSDSADKPNSKKPRCETNVEEVWFAGCHCDVGGGSVPNGTRPNLAHISLRWMVRECFRMNSSILFKEQRIKAIGIDPSSIYPIVKPRPEISSFSSSSSDIAVADPQTWGEYFYSWIPSTSKLPETLPIPTQSEEELDAIDALAPAYDQLTLHPGKWWLMEKKKEKKNWRGEDGKQVEVQETHNNHGRTIPPHSYSHGGKIKVHRTVQIRMEATFGGGNEKGQKYIPLARVGLKKARHEDKKTFEQAVNEGWIQWVA